MRIDPRKNTEREILTTRRGRRLATSIEGTVTGHGGNLMVIDDPIKPGDAHSKAVRDKVIEAYRSTLITRGDDKPKARTVVVMQRVDAEDLAGYLQEQGGYEVLNLPAIAMEDASFDLGYGFTYHRKEGEVLHPRHEPRTILDEIKRRREEDAAQHLAGICLVLDEVDRPRTAAAAADASLERIEQLVRVDGFVQELGRSERDAPGARRPEFPCVRISSPVIL